MAPTLSETIFVPPHTPWRLAQSRFRLLPGVAFLAVFVLIGLALSPYADVAAVSDVRGARSTTPTMRGAQAYPYPAPIGATASAPPSTTSHTTLDTDDAVIHMPAVRVVRPRPAPADPPKHHTKHDPMPPSHPGAHGNGDGGAQGKGHGGGGHGPGHGH